MLQSQPLAHVFEAAAHGQRRRSQHRALQLVEQAVLQNGSRRRWAWPAEKHSALARGPLRGRGARSRKRCCDLPTPSGSRAAPAIPARGATKLKTSSGFDGRFSSSEPRRVSACCNARNSSPFSSRNSRRFSKAKRPSPWRQQSEEEHASARASSSARPKAKPTACGCAAARLRRRGTVLRSVHC